MTPRAVSLPGLLSRTLGVHLWRLAHPLPGTSRAWRGFAITAVILAVVAGMGAWATAREVGRTADSVRRRSAGTPLLHCAAALDSLAEQPWTRLQPAFSNRTHGLADRIREGRGSLQALLDVYDSNRLQINRLTTPGRLTLSWDDLAWIQEALDGVGTPWHRGTLLFGEVERATAPYRELARSPRSALGGTVREAPPRHLLAIAAAESRSFLGGVGDRFEVPLGAGPLILSAVTATDRRVLEDRSLPPGELGARVVFPATGLRFGLAFDAELEAAAPPLPGISDEARAELGDATSR